VDVTVGAYALGGCREQAVFAGQGTGLPRAEVGVCTWLLLCKWQSFLLSSSVSCI